MVDEPTLGLRERKKQRTRRLIADTARELFAERGFDRVTVAEIARAAEVSEATVFNYFPAKEDLFYDRLEAFEERLLTALREREPGQSAIAAFRDFLLGERGVFDLDAGATEQLRTVTRIVTESEALLARERQIFTHYARALAALLAEETGAAADDVVPAVAANAMIGLHRALIDFVRGRALAGATAAQIGPELREQAERGFAQLEAGLGGYAVRR